LSYHIPNHLQQENKETILLIKPVWKLLPAAPEGADAIYQTRAKRARRARREGRLEWF